jgi:hypothetical protein
MPFYTLPLPATPLSLWDISKFMSVLEGSGGFPVSSGKYIQTLGFQDSTRMLHLSS